MESPPDAAPTLSDSELVLHFESVGDNCELGLVQRRVGAEPLGLLRFAGVPLRSLLRALATRFHGATDPATVRVQVENGEYMVKLARFDVNYHADIKADEATAEAVHRQNCQTAAFLVDKLLADLQTPAKILVFRQNEPVLAGDLLDLRIALAAYGPNTLLWVQEACPGHPPGTVAVADERLMIGYVNRLAPRHDVPDLHLVSWLTMLRRAHAIWLRPEPERMQAGREAAATLRRIDVTFGLEGNAESHLGYGWSGPEPGYQWSVGERSLITLPHPGAAEDYWLEMEVNPFLAPPLLPQQRLDVVVNGTLVRSFEPLPRACVTCIIPGRLAPAGEPFRIRLDHPYAASPILVAGGSDDRRLAVSFSRLSLVAP